MEFNLKIIILDDDLFFGNLLRNFLLNQGYRFIELFQDEFKCVESINQGLSIVILDHHLKNSNGFDVMEKIKQKNSKAIIIYLSGQEYMHIAVKAIRLGAIDYIEKSSNYFFQLKQLIDEIITKKGLIKIESVE